MDYFSIKVCGLVLPNISNNSLYGGYPMTVIKEEILKLIQNMPGDISLEDIMAELYFRYQVDEGLRQLDEGKGIPHEEVERRMEKWLKK